MTSSTSSTPGAAANAATQCSTRVLPLRVSSCLGTVVPNRLPTPPPSTTATIRVTATSGTLPPSVGVVIYDDRGAGQYAGKTAFEACKGDADGGGGAGCQPARRHAGHRPGDQGR